ASASAAAITAAMTPRRLTPGAYRAHERPSPRALDGAASSEDRARRRRGLDAQTLGHEERDDGRMPPRADRDGRAEAVGRERTLDRETVEVGSGVAAEIVAD